MALSSPASTGPAGAYFEAQVGAHYLLTMLIGAEPRGLPGTTIDRVEFQRAAEGYPLDDIIVHAHDRQGNNAVLEIQVKRRVTFAPSDQEFKKIVDQISDPSRDRDFLNHRHELAVAVAQRSRKLDGPYQDVLTWARRLDSHKTFFGRIRRSGTANADMRTFVQTFRNNIRETTIKNDDRAVWQLLSRLKILPFDYTAQGSEYESWDKERAVRALHSDASHNAGDFWKRLIELVFDTESSGGGFDQERLIEHLKKGSFRLAGSHRFATARATLAEAARNALDDIDDQVGHVSLSRAGWLAAIRSARTRGRYLEIRGDAGVGKSALLKHFAQELSNEAPIIVLSPKRATGGGWIAMRSVLGFDGSARSLLVDLAASGGATLFLDGLDFFTTDERLTVRDLVRQASKVPGFDVIATARRDFGIDEPNWLGKAALERLGPAGPVTVRELSTTEIGELHAIAPELGALLAESHPARAVTRNLFRLSRLVSQPGDGQFPRTEVDMAEQWWQSADGAGSRDALHRERARVLKDLAEQTLDYREPLETTSHPAPPVDALVLSQTLRDLGDDRMAFHHDVLRDWAIANLLYLHPDTQDRLPLDQPAPASLVRGVELAARMALERGSDDSRWKKLLDQLSHEGAHGSWRRAVLLAPARSEIDIAPFETVSDILLADKCQVLRELIGTVLAVDGRSASDFAAGKMDVPEDFFFPAAPSWIRLVRWLLTLREAIPPKAIRDVARLYTGWCAPGVGFPRKIRMILWTYCSGGRVRPSDVMMQYDGWFVPDGDKICKNVLETLHHWLSEIETSRYPDDIGELRRPFGGELNDDEVASLEKALRTSLLALCCLSPSLASEYVRSLLARGQQAHSVRLSVISSPGSLAHAAPQELAQLAITALVPDDEERTEHWLRHPPFLSTNHLFAPPSPDHGPFIDLLTHAPKVGLSLIRQIVDHAISHYATGRTNGMASVSLCFPDRDRVFTWPQTYAWARESQSRDFCVTSALMALGKWGKQRIENGESLDTVLEDLIGGSDTPAAYLLLAVDLLIDQWPASRESAIPFVTCPELLGLDRSLVWSDRIFAERIPGNVAGDPVPRAAIGRSLVDLLGDCAVSGPSELRERLASLLRAAVERLGPYGEHAGLNDPAFMASHALNRLDPSNWKQVTDSPPSATVAMEYVTPEVEARHTARLAGQSGPIIDDAKMRASIQVAAEDPTQSSSDLAAAAVEWVRQLPDDSPKHRWGITAAALLLVRDSSDIRSQDEQWARQVFADLVQSELNPLYESVHTLSMNPPAMAFVGLAHALKTSPSQADIRSLLDLATRGDCATAYGFAAAADTLHTIDERLPRAVLRTAFASCIRPYDRGRWMSVEDPAALTEKHQRRIRAAVEAEQAWLDGLRSEPMWPTFPRQEPRIKRGIPIFRDELSPDRNPVPATPPTEYVNCRGAALWLNSASVLFSHTTRPWLSKVVNAYASWTAVANGFGLNQYESVDSTVIAEWNDSFSTLLANCLAGLEFSELDQFALSHITSLPDRSFIVVCEQFLLHVDKEYIAGDLATRQAVHIRSVIVERLITSDEWRRWKAEWMAPEKNLGRLVARLFMHDGWFQPPRCWLCPDGIDLVEPLFPTLWRLVEGGPCIFFALSVIEVEPRPNHLEFILAASEAWLRLYHDSVLWVDYAVGRRFCGLINTIFARRPSVLSGDEELRKRVDDALVSLTSLGVVEAAVLEETLANAEA